MGKRIVFSINGAWISTYKVIILEYYLTQYAKINSKYVKDVNTRAETIKFLECTQKSL